MPSKQRPTQFVLYYAQSRQVPQATTIQAPRLAAKYASIFSQSNALGEEAKSLDSYFTINSHIPDNFRKSAG